MIFEMTVRDQPLSLSTDVGDWIDGVKKKIARRVLTHLDEDTSSKTRYLEMARLAELPGALVACAFFQADLNAALTRAGLFMGAGLGLKKESLVAHADHRLINYKKLVAGHNLPGAVLRRFFAAADAAPREDQHLDAAESALRDCLSRILKPDERFYLIGFSVQSTKDPRGVLGHEVFHAFYDLQSAYRTGVQEFWRDAVSSDDRAAITDTIGRAYNVDDEDLVIDEFQAYLLQDRAERDMLKDFVAAYRAGLRERVAPHLPDLGQLRLRP